MYKLLNVSGTSFKCLCKPGTQPTALAADLLATSSTVTGLCTRLPAPAPGQARPDMLPMLHDVWIGEYKLMLCLLAHLHLRIY